MRSGLALDATHNERMIITMLSYLSRCEFLAYQYIDTCFVKMYMLLQIRASKLCFNMHQYDNSFTPVAL